MTKRCCAFRNGIRLLMVSYFRACRRRWRKKLTHEASPKAYGSLRRLPQSAATRKPSASQPVRARAESKVNPLGIFALPPLPSRESADSLEAEPSNSANPSPAQGIMQKNLHVSDVLSRAKERETQGESWDDDFASDVTFSGVHSEFWLNSISCIS